MKIVIGGAGDVGCHLAKLLSKESHEITVVDIDSDKLTRIDSTLDILVVQGSITSPLTLEQTISEATDIFIGVADEQDTNIVACLIAKKLGAHKVIARVQTAEYLDRKYAMMLHRMGIDVIISPEEQAANAIINLVEASILTETHAFANHLLNLFGITLSEDSSIVGLTVDEMYAQFNSHQWLKTICIIRPNADLESGYCSFVPDIGEVFQVDDNVYFIAKEEARNDIYHMSGKIQSYLSNVLILGGGKIGSRAAMILQNAKHHIKLIERDRQKAEQVANELNNVLVLAGDGRDSDFLVEEGLEETDAFIALTGRSETNIVACLLAKSKGVKKNIALVDNTDYIHLSKAVGVDCFINKKLLTANAILKYIRKGKVMDVITLHDQNANVMEFRVNEHSKVLGQTIGQLSLPEQAVIGGIVRKNQSLIAAPEIVIERFDRVVVFAHSCCINNVETLF